MPSFLTGLLQGFNATAAQGRKEAREDEDTQFARESKMLGILSSSDDPEISNAAVSALAEISAGGKRPKEGYLQRIVGGGGSTVHPAVAGVLRLLNTPHVTPGLPVSGGQNQAPSMAAPASTPQPAPTGASGAMPEKAATEPGGGPTPDQLAPPSPSTPSALPVTPTTGLPPIQQPVIGATAGVSTPRRVFMTSEERQAQTNRLHAQAIGADLEAQSDAIYNEIIHRGGTPEQARRAVMVKIAPQLAMTRSIPGIIPASALAGEFDERGTPIDATSKKGYREIDDGMGGRTYRETVMPATVSRPQYQRNVLIGGQPWITQVQPDGSLKPIAQQFTNDRIVTLTADDGSQRAVFVPGRDSAPTSVPHELEPGESFGGPAGTAPPTPSAGGMPQAAGTPPPTPQTTTPGTAPSAPSTPTGGGLATRGPQMKTTTVRTPDGTVQTALKWTDGRLTTYNRIPFPEGTVEVPLSAAMPDKDEQAILDTIAEASPMIARVKELLKGRETENTLGSAVHGAVQNLEYKTPFSVSDPLYKELIPLTSLLRVFATTAYLKGSRNYRWVQQIQDHMPKSTDTPARIMDNLNNIENSFQKISAEAGRGRVGAAVGTPGATPTIPPEVQSAPKGSHIAMPNGDEWVKPSDGSAPVQIKKGG